MYVCIYICISYLCPLRRPGNSDTLVAQSTLSAQILVSRYYSSLNKNQGSLEKIADSRAGPEKVQKEPEEVCCTIK